MSIFPLRAASAYARISASTASMCSSLGFILAIEMWADGVDIGKTIHPHPTLGESIGMAAEVYEGGGGHGLAAAAQAVAHSMSSSRTRGPNFSATATPAGVVR